MRRLFPVTEGTADRTGRRGAHKPAADAGAAERTGVAPDAGPAPEAGAAGSPESPEAGAEAAEWGLDELADAYAYPEPSEDPGAERNADGAHGHATPGPRAWLRANMVSSLDGAGMHDGRSHPLSGPADMRVFGVLRALADVVIVGAGTVRAEGYRPARARQAFEARRAAAGQGPAPVIAVVSASLDLDFSRPLFTEPLVPTLLVTGAAAPADRLDAARAAGAQVVTAGAGPGVEPGEVVRALAERGHRRLLIEGGPHLLGQFVAADVLDELCLTMAPLLAAGRAPRITRGPEVSVPHRFDLFSALEDDGFLFTSYRRSTEQSRS